MPRSSRMPTLSGKETVILELLLEGHEMYGLELVDASRRRLKRGTVYVTLGRMQEKGYVESRTEPPVPGAIGLPRRLSRPTADGAAVLEAWTRMATALARLRPARGLS